MKLKNDQKLKKLHGVVKFVREEMKTLDIYIKALSHRHRLAINKIVRIEEKGCEVIFKNGKSSINPSCNVYKDRVSLSEDLGPTLYAAFCIHGHEGQVMDTMKQFDDKSKIDEVIAKYSRNAKAQNELYLSLIDEFEEMITPTELLELIARCTIINNGEQSNAEKILAGFFLKEEIKKQQARAKQGES